MLLLTGKILANNGVRDVLFVVFFLSIPARSETPLDFEKQNVVKITKFVDFHMQIFVCFLPN